MKQYQSGQVVIAAIATGFILGFLVAIAVGYYWWKTPADLVMEPVVEVRVHEPPVNDLRVETDVSPYQHLIIQAETRIRDADYAGAIDILMQADLVAATVLQAQQAAHLLGDAVRLRVEQLERRGSEAEIDRLYESLTLAMPERAEFYLQLAEHRIGMGNNDGALPVLAQIENHAQWGSRARELIDMILAPAPGTLLARVPLVRAGNQFVVVAELDGEREVSLLIDTGASLTIVSPEVLVALGYNMAGESGRFSTANGVVDAPLIPVRSLSVGDQLVRPITVGAIALSRRTEPVDGLLGMNFLQQFEFTLDQQAGVLELRYRRGHPNAR